MRLMIWMELKLKLYDEMNLVKCVKDDDVLLHAKHLILNIFNAPEQLLCKLCICNFNHMWRTVNWNYFGKIHQQKFSNRNHFDFLFHFPMWNILKYDYSMIRPSGLFTFPSVIPLCQQINFSSLLPASTFHENHSQKKLYFNPQWQSLKHVICVLRSYMFRVIFEQCVNFVHRSFPFPIHICTRNYYISIYWVVNHFRILTAGSICQWEIIFLLFDVIWLNCAQNDCGSQYISIKINKMNELEAQWKIYSICRTSNVVRGVFFSLNGSPIKILLMKKKFPFDQRKSIEYGKRFPKKYIPKIIADI